MESNVEDGCDLVSTDVQLRELPYPYRAMLAICSDLDETPDRPGRASDGHGTIPSSRCGPKDQGCLPADTQ